MTFCGRGVWAVAALLWAVAPALAQTLSQPPLDGPPRMVLDRVVASVNDEALTLSEVQEEGQPVIRKIFQDYVGVERDRRVGQAEQALMNDLIDRRLLLQVAKREGMLPSAAEVQGALEELKRNNNAADDAQFRALLKAEGLTMEQVRRTITERLAIGRLLARQIRSSIILTEEDLTKYYEANRDKFRRVPEAQIHHALFPVRAGGDPANVKALFSIGAGDDAAAVKARAEEAAAKVRAGAEFGATATQYGAEAVTSGADLLTVHRGELAPEIEEAAFGLPVGQVSSPIRTEAGFHLILVDKVRAEPVAPFAEVREPIREALFQEKYEARRKDYVAGLRARASIQIYLKEGEILGIPGAGQEAQAAPRKQP